MFKEILTIDLPWVLGVLLKFYQVDPPISVFVVWLLLFILAACMQGHLLPKEKEEMPSSHQLMFQPRSCMLYIYFQISKLIFQRNPARSEYITFTFCWYLKIQGLCQ